MRSSPQRVKDSAMPLSRRLDALAILPARLFVIELAAGRPTAAKLSHDHAARALHEVARHRPQARPQARALLGVLKAAMAAAHPDRGGSAEAFIKARARYVAARRRTRAV